MSKVFTGFYPTKTKDLSNLTGGQIQEVLDFLILNSLRPIVLSTNVFDVQLAYLLTCTAQNRKRKLSALNREEFISLLSQALLTSDPVRKFELISSAKIERSFLYNFVVLFLDAANGYLEDYTNYMTCSQHDIPRYEAKLRSIERSLGCFTPSLFCVLTTSRDYLHAMYQFRNSIVENYVKMAAKQARSFVKMKGTTFDFNDVRQNFLTAITKALDKYDSSKGAITSYVKFWVKNAQTSGDHEHEYGVAFKIPQLQRKKLAQGQSTDVNYGVSLESSASDGDSSLHNSLVGHLGPEETSSVDEEARHVRMLIKESDPTGIARLYLDVEEAFTEQELSSMVTNMQALVREEISTLPEIESEIDRPIIDQPKPEKKKKKKKLHLRLHDLNYTRPSYQTLEDGPRYSALL